MKNENVLALILTPYEMEALWVSLKVTSVAVLFVLPIALLLGFLLSKKHFWGKAFLEAIVYLPLVLPPVVIGYLLLVLFSNQSAIGKFLLEYFHISFAFQWQGAALAVGVVAMPLMVRSIRLAFDLIDESFAQAARTLGASPVKVFMSITLPLALPGVISGIVLGFARGLGEFGATITFAANIPGVTQTIPLAMYTYTQTPGGELAALRLCIIAVTVSIAALLLSEVLSRVMKSRIGARNEA